MKNTLLSKDDFVDTYEEIAVDTYRLSREIYGKFGLFLITMLMMLLGAIVLYIVQDVIMDESLLNNPVVLNLEFIMLVVWLISICATIIFRIRFVKTNAKYQYFRIMILLHNYDVDETELLNNKEMQLKVFRSVLTDTRFSPKDVFKGLNTIYEGKMNQEWCFEHPKTSA